MEVVPQLSSCNRPQPPLPLLPRQPLLPPQLLKLRPPLHLLLRHHRVLKRYGMDPSSMMVLCDLTCLTTLTLTHPLCASTNDTSTLLPVTKSGSGHVMTLARRTVSSKSKVNSSGSGLRC